jgi:hypothetical protein
MILYLQILQNARPAGLWNLWDCFGQKEGHAFYEREKILEYLIESEWFNELISRSSSAACLNSENTGRIYRFAGSRRWSLVQNLKIKIIESQG